MEYFIGWIVLSFVVAVIAANRGRSVFGFFLLSLVLSPIISGIILVSSPVIEPEEDDDRGRDEPAEQPAARPVQLSTADELMKLAALRDKGVLTEDEFAGQKRRLLSRL